MIKFPTQIGVGGLVVSEREKELVNEVLNSSRLSYGPFCERLEKDFASLHSRQFATLSNSGTSSLQVALAALKEQGAWKDGDEVLVPALTFVATANVVLQNQLKPIFVDVDPLTYNINPDLIEAALTERTRAIIPVHLFGLPCDMDRIVEIAKRRGLKVLEDSCETMFVSAQGHPVGSRGDIACFSTYVAHLLCTGVGGLACTNDPELALMMKSLLNHGRDSIYLKVDDDQKATSPEGLFRVVDRRFSFVRMGYSYRITEMEAALGVAQLEQKDAMLAARKKHAAFLSEQLRDLGKYLQLPTIPQGFDHAFMMYPIVLSEEVNRDTLLIHLEERNIETRYMLPLINQPYFLKLFGDLSANFPEAHRINRKGFYIGCHQTLNEDTLRFVTDAFHEYFKIHPSSRHEVFAKQ